MTTPVLAVRNLTTSFRVDEVWTTVVNGISFEIGPRETVAIVGESGSGKSTLGRAITRLLPNVEVAELSGSVLFGGQDVLAMAPDTIRALQIGRAHV